MKQQSIQWFLTVAIGLVLLGGGCPEQTSERPCTSVDNCMWGEVCRNGICTTSSQESTLPDGASPDGASPDGASPDGASPDISPGLCVGPPWKFKADKGVLGLVGGSQGRLYVRSDNKLYQLDTKGVLQWQYETGAAVNWVIEGASGRLYLGTATQQQQQQGYIYALNQTGTLQWKFPTEGSVSSLYLSTDGTLYGASWGMNKGYVYALNPEGASLWQFDPKGIVMYLVLSAQGTLYVATYGLSEQLVYVLDKQGTPKGQVPIPGLSNAVLGPAGTLYVVGKEPFLYVVTPEGTLQGKYPLAAAVNALLVGADETLYAGLADGQVYALNSKGEVQWKFKTGGAILNMAVMNEGTLYVASQDAHAYALNKQGTQLWKFPVAGLKYLIAGGAGLLDLVSEQSIYALNSEGTQQWQYTLGELALSLRPGPEGAVYFSATNRVYALDKKGQGPVCTVGEKSCEGQKTLECLCGKLTSVAECPATEGCKDGQCVTCTPHARKGCSLDDVYWFDSCERREELIEDCQGDKKCSNGTCQVPPVCNLSCSANRGCELAVTYSCGTGSKTCSYNRDSTGRVSSMTCQFDNGRSFSCSIAWNSVGQCSGTCQAEGKTCSFHE